MVGMTNPDTNLQRVREVIVNGWYQDMQEELTYEATGVYSDSGKQRLEVHTGFHFYDLNGDNHKEGRQRTIDLSTFLCIHRDAPKKVVEKITDSLGQ